MSVKVHRKLIGGPYDGQRVLIDSQDTLLRMRTGETYALECDSLRYQEPAQPVAPKPRKIIRTIRDNYDAMPSAEKDRFWAMMEKMLLSARSRGILRPQNTPSEEIANLLDENGIGFAEYT